ncbi:MAG: hypothetical protein OXH84_02180 [Gammaproteobacteria bacterium]|nr:hypothetical protein [Gammaproteobacteria bacterium]
MTNIPTAKLALRHRTNFEAIGAGALLARKFWWELLAGWLVLAVPVFIVVWFIPNLFWSIFLLWLFKPLYERIPLRFIASTLFDQQATAQQTLRTIFMGDTWLWLSLFRLFPGRSTLTPIAALENTESAPIRIGVRRRLIRDRIIGYYLILHLLMFCMEISLVVFFLAMITWVSSIIFSITPELPTFNPQAIFAFINAIGSHVFKTLIFVSFAVIAPFYICCGFAIYLNKRIELEGWDIDLGFRRLISRISIVLIATVLVFTNGEQIYAQVHPGNMGDETTVHETVSSEIEKIYHEQVVTEKTIRQQKQPRSQQPRNNAPTIDLGLASFFARVVQILVIFAIIGLIAYLLWQLRKLDFSRFKQRKGNLGTQSTRIIEEVFQKLELPENIVASSRNAWESGDYREALSLLYRGALYCLVARFDCPINLSHTEASCLQLVAQNVPGVLSAFASITECWQLVAYAHKAIDSPTYNDLVQTYEASFT